MKNKIIMLLLAVTVLITAACDKRSEAKKLPEEYDMKKYNEIYLAGGCFWGAEKYMGKIHGVKATSVGYANGNTKNPTYEDVCKGNTGFAETVKVVYDPKEVSLPFLLEMYYGVIDPTTLNRQGNDTGTQYRTGIYYTNPKDERIIKKSLGELSKNYKKPIAIEARPLTNYYPAEDYHQQYLDKNPSGYCHIGESKFKEAEKARDKGIIDPIKYPAKDSVLLKKELNPVQYAVTKENQTEPAYKNEYWNKFEPGIYVDVTTGEPLFSSTDKFEAGCGWPSFSKPIDPKVVAENTDSSHGMVRREVRSRSGDAHLGHVFDDGPKELGGERYCINSASLRFIPKDRMEAEGYSYLLHYIDLP